MKKPNYQSLFTLDFATIFTEFRHFNSANKKKLQFDNLN